MRARRAATRDGVCTPSTLKLRRRCRLVQFELPGGHTPRAELRAEPPCGSKNYYRILNSPLKCVGAFIKTIEGRYENGAKYFLSLLGNLPIIIDPCAPDRSIS